MLKLSIITLVFASLLVVGCGKPSENPPGYTKEDFKRTAPPPNWRGPGQPGGPPAGALSGPAPKAMPPGMGGGPAGGPATGPAGDR